MTKLQTLLFLILSFLFVSQGLAQHKTNKESLMQTVNLLCSDEYAGRLPGHEGYNKAAAYMAEEFEKLGLQKIDGSYYQKFPVEYNQIYSPLKFNLIQDGIPVKEYTPGKDFVCRGFSGSGDIKTEVVFCGYGVDEDFYSDYNGVEVKNKIVLIFKPNPSWNIENKNWGSGYPRAKSNTAVKHGAAGLIMVSLPNSQNPQKPVASVLHGGGIQEEGLPQIHVEIDVAEELLRNSGYTLSQLQSIIDTTKKPFSIAAKIEAELYVEAEYKKEAETMNVWGLLEGISPNLKDEYIIIGAHLDHVGMQGEVIFPGANDNASGSAAVLEIARTIIKNGMLPKRSIIFTLFSSEEQGIFGAQYMADNLPVPGENVAAMLNLDCIAYGDSIHIGNGLSAPQLWALARSVDKQNDNYVVNHTWRGGGADAGPFHDKGIPALYFASTNSYDNIHTIYDTPGSLNAPLMEKITRLAYLILAEAAGGNYNREEVIK
jgi:aminopeptidase YwaD